MNNHVVLVTGSSRGIGKAIALSLSGKASAVAVHFMQNRAEAENTADAAAKKGAASDVFQADLTVESEAVGLIREVEDRFGRIDILINNVGPLTVKRWDRIEAEEWNSVLAGNLNSAFYCLRAALPGMKRRKWGRIVNIGYSRAEQLTAFFQITPYAIAKTGLLILTRTAAADAGKYGITVNMVSPGLMEGGVLPPDQKVPLGRLGRPDDIAEAVRFLVSDEAGYITGENIIVSGGWKA